MAKFNSGKKSNKRDYRACLSKLKCLGNWKGNKITKKSCIEICPKRKNICEKIKTLRLQHIKVVATLLHCLVFTSFFPLSKRFIIRFCDHVLSFSIFDCTVPMILMLQRLFLCPIYFLGTGFKWYPHFMSIHLNKLKIDTLEAIATNTVRYVQFNKGR